MELPIEEKVYEKLREKKYMLATAESCTGGMIAAKIINVAGASEIFSEGYITYANEAKTRLLKVKRSTLKKYGAVSAQTAEEMAKGVLRVSKADCSVITTGIAGPGGGKKEKPVGLVFIACCIKGETTVEEHHFKGNRSEVRMQAVDLALNLLLRCI